MAGRGQNDELGGQRQARGVGEEGQSTANYSTGNGTGMHADGDLESGHAAATDGTVPKMTALDRSVGKRSSRASKRGTRTTAAGGTGDGNGGVFDQTSGTTGQESNP